MLDISSYQEVVKTATCKFCKSTNVTWFQKDDGTKRFFLAEVFNIDGQDITSRSDTHWRYCAKPHGFMTKEQADKLRADRIAEILEATYGEPSGDDPMPADPVPAPEWTPTGEGMNHRVPIRSVWYRVAWDALPFKDISMEQKAILNELEIANTGTDYQLVRRTKWEHLQWRLLNEIPKG